MRVHALFSALAIIHLCGTTTIACGEETAIRVGNIDAVLTTPANVEQPVVALLIAGSGTTDHDGNGPQARPGTLKKLAAQLAARNIATLRYDKRGAGGWKAEFGKPEDFRFKDFVEDAAVSPQQRQVRAGSGGRTQRRRPGRDSCRASRAGGPPGLARHRGQKTGRSSEGPARTETDSRRGARA